MTTHIRRLLPLEEDHNPTFFSTKNDPPPSKIQERENPTNYTPLKLNPPFDSAMALTVLVLITALFFMGFFSIYIRRFADDSSVDPTRRRRSSNSAAGSSTTSYLTSRLRDGCSSSPKGVDPTVVESLPVHMYFGGDAKQGNIKNSNIDEMECAICLSEFEERELVKEIPYCGHVFHVGCIDTWFISHVTCPLCRTANLLVKVGGGKEEEQHVEIAEERGLSVSEVESSGGREVRLVVDEGDTWRDNEREVGSVGERRSTSCIWFGERVRLHRSLSF
ncbi:hypothetical protein BVRB_9g225350 [Beta vulgaris subsp. vulgaris]|uniref:RING-type E3 ubiquitin transferase n=1 Tax=Beta vulgaris subsp. vulgaris TaxID=3555 RepID=A0A0J8DZX1_BETVV|nr:hypothetical protein BVRB_9g225350 [Beta vulgaris subsp. vulgaris]